MVNIGSGYAVTLAELVALAEQVTGRRVPLDYADAQDGDVPATCADIACAQGLFGYRPRVSLAEGLARHAAWLAGHDPSAARGFQLPAPAQATR